MPFIGNPFDGIGAIGAAVGGGIGGGGNGMLADPTVAYYVSWSLTVQYFDTLSLSDVPVGAGCPVNVYWLDINGSPVLTQNAKTDGSGFAGISNTPVSAADYASIASVRLYSSAAIGTALYSGSLTCGVNDDTQLLNVPGGGQVLVHTLTNKVQTLLLSKL